MRFSTRNSFLFKMYLLRAWISDRTSLVILIVFVMVLFISLFDVAKCSTSLIMSISKVKEHCLFYFLLRNILTGMTPLTMNGFMGRDFKGGGKGDTVWNNNLSVN